jgi:hypothetical protein
MTVAPVTGGAMLQYVDPAAWAFVAGGVAAIGLAAAFVSRAKLRATAPT